MLENYPDILTIADLYHILPLGKNTIYKLIADKRIKSIRIANKILIPKKFLIDFLETA